MSPDFPAYKTHLFFLPLSYSCFPQLSVLPFTVEIIFNNVSTRERERERDSGTRMKRGAVKTPNIHWEMHLLLTFPILCRMSSPRFLSLLFFEASPMENVWNGGQWRKWAAMRNSARSKASGKRRVERGSGPGMGASHEP